MWAKNVPRMDYESDTIKHLCIFLYRKAFSVEPPFFLIHSHRLGKQV